MTHKIPVQKLIQSDFQEIDSATIGDSSIDLIFTDPSYHREWLPLYEPLGKLASRVLKEEVWSCPQDTTDYHRSLIT